MKVMLIAPQPFYTQRGTPIAVRLLAEELALMGHEIDLLTYWEGEDIDIPGVTIVRAMRVPGVRDIPIGFSGRKLIADCSLFVKFLRLIFGQRYDVIHAVEEAVFFAALTRWIHRAQVIYDMDSSLAQQMSRQFESARFLHAIFRAIEKFAIRRSNKIVAVCEDLAVTARQYIDPSKVFLLNDIAPPIATTEEASDQLREHAEPGEMLALYVGNLESYQGVDLLVDAAEQLPADVKVRILIIGGSEEDIAKYRSAVSARSLDNRIVFLGPRPLTQLMAYLQQADILLSPRASGNNTPLKLYCYMSAGKPIVATEIVSHTQVLTPELAMLVPPTASAIADALQTLASDMEMRDQLGERVRKEADSNFTLDAFRSSLREIYADFSQQPGRE